MSVWLKNKERIGMLIEHQQQGTGGLWFVEPNEKRLAEMSYSRVNEDQLVIEHTWVDDSLRGQHVGYYLVETAVNFAHENGIRIIPKCPFATSVFEREPRFNDVL